jgi:hypothetical protein
MVLKRNSGQFFAMTPSARAFTPAGRDAGLRRLRTANRLLVGASVAVTGLLADVAAQAFPGHKRTVHAAVATRSPTTPNAAPAHHRTAGRPRAHARHARLHPPAQAPTTSTQQSPGPAPQATAPAPQITNPAPQATTPAPQVTAIQAPPPQAPAPVVSGGS